MPDYSLRVDFEALREEAADEVIANIIASNEEREGIYNFTVYVYEGTEGWDPEVLVEGKEDD